MGLDRLQDLPAEQIDSTLQALSSIHRVYLNDSLITDVKWRFYDHPVREQPGLLYDLPAYDLPRGEYLLRIEDQTVGRTENRDEITQKYRDSTYWQEWITIPFVR